MKNAIVNWRQWYQFFANRSHRQLPALEAPESYATVPNSVARSLAIFQLGESGGGSVVEQARQSEIEEIDGNYADAVELFVQEEHRHAELLAICVRNLGGTLIRRNWTANAFVFARRLIGLRLKILVLLAAEVVGICHYHLLATRMPPGKLKSLLSQIVNDERAHLYFHCHFLQTQTSTFWRRILFIVTWRAIMSAAAISVLIDHRNVFRDLDISITTVWRRWTVYSRLAERLVTAGPIAPRDELNHLWPETNQCPTHSVKAG